jgi:hypothetical protein
MTTTDQCLSATSTPLPVVRLMVGQLDNLGVTDLRWRLHDLLTGAPQRVIVDLSEIDPGHELIVFAVLVNAVRLTRMRESELLIAHPPASYRLPMGVCGLREH